MKVLYVATVVSHICQFHLPYLEMLHNQGIEVHVAARNNLAEKNGLQLKFTDKYFDIPFQRSPKDRRNITSYKQLKRVIKENHYDLVVCNTPMGGFLTRIAARKTRKKGTRVVYMAHGFHFYKGAPKKYWMVFYPVEKLFARLCDMVITINEEDYLCAKENFKTDVRHIHGVGVKTERFFSTDDSTKVEIRRGLGVSEQDFLILCTGELNKNKNQTQLIEAAYLLKDKMPNLKVLLAGNGPYEEVLLKQVEEYNLSETVKLLGYRTDIEKIVAASDLIVSCSKREGLGLNVIEGMLSKKPIVATINRGHTELIKNSVNGFLVNIGDDTTMADRIYDIATDIKRAGEMGLQGYEIAQKYTVDSVKQELTQMLFKDIL